MRARRTAVQRRPRNVPPTKQRILEELAEELEQDFQEKSPPKKIMRTKPRKSERER